MPLPKRLHQPPSPPPCLLPPNSSSNLLSLNHPNNFLTYSAEFVSRISLHSNGFRSSSLTRSSKQAADMDELEEEKITDFAKLKRKVEAFGVKFDSCTPGQYDLLYCPKTVQWWTIDSEESVISHKPKSGLCNMEVFPFTMWMGGSGAMTYDTKQAHPRVNIHRKFNSSRSSTGESLRLEPLGDELLAYFAERMISRETLQRNNVMQVAGDKKTIAFPYRQNGLLVGCKYRTVEKKFWQGKNTEKMLYGLDDTAEADEIIIVEGEIDKLSVEEAGYYNCVSVPGGAPQTVSLKEIPSREKDTSFQYIWNCKDYLDKASRIILATDGDLPGQALAEELARRLGKERCWRVHWPQKDEVSSFKDANEVLKHLGADALRDTIDKAELYQMQNLEENVSY